MGPITGERPMRLDPEGKRSARGPSALEKSLLRANSGIASLVA
jgi:hypothetical protein